MHRFSDSAVSADTSPISGLDDVAFSMSEQDRHTEVRISELDGWPAFPLTDATPATSPSPAYGSRPERLANSSLLDSFIPYPKPVYPGAFSDPFFTRFLPLDNFNFDDATLGADQEWALLVDATKVRLTINAADAGDAATPEPGTMMLLAMGGIGVLLRRRRRDVA